MLLAISEINVSTYNYVHYVQFEKNQDYNCIPPGYNNATVSSTERVTDDAVCIQFRAYAREVLITNICAINFSLTSSDRHPISTMTNIYNR